ncbi:MAG: hypothetical protein IJ170_06320, partial [Ruminococcus sp.]|nr:hypothetical protein [Ruminococcus sp.]
MDRFERRAAEIMRLGEKRIAEKKRRNTIIRRSAVSSGACAAAIAGVWLMSGRDLREAAKPPRTELMIVETTAPTDAPPAAEVSQTTAVPSPTATAQAVSGTAPQTSAQPVTGTAPTTERTAAVGTAPMRTATAARAAAVSTVQTAAATERASSTAAAIAQTAPPETTFPEEPMGPEDPPITAPSTLPQTTAQVPETMPVSATTIAQVGYYFYDPEKTYIFYLDDVSYEVSGEAASYEDIQSMKAVGYTDLYTTNSQGHTITISAMISTTQDKIICTVETAAGQANFIV